MQCRGQKQTRGGSRRTQKQFLSRSGLAALLATLALAVAPAPAFADDDDDDVMIFRVTDIADDKVVLDGNHPLAGMALVFTCTVTDVRPASAEEIEHGHVHDDEDGPTCH